MPELPQEGTFERFERDVEFLSAFYTAELKKSQLPLLRSLTLQLAFQLERQGVHIGTASEQAIARDFFGKIICEAWGLIACLEAGAYLASFHHARACIEIFVGFNHLFRKEATRRKRATRFMEFPKVHYFNMFEEGDSVVSEVLGPEQHNEWIEAGKPEEWRKLYKPKGGDLTKVKHWHFPRSILDLFNEVSDPALLAIYDKMSHGTHLSPLSQALSDGTKSIGLPTVKDDLDLDSINGIVSGGIVGIGSILLLYNKLAHTPFEISIEIDGVRNKFGVDE